MDSVLGVLQTAMRDQLNSIEASGFRLAASRMTFNSALEAKRFADSLSVSNDAALEIKSVYEPGNTQADPSGFIYKLNIDTAGEMVNMTSDKRLYETNIRSYNLVKELYTNTLSMRR